MNKSCVSLLPVVAFAFISLLHIMANSEDTSPSLNTFGILSYESEKVPLAPGGELTLSIKKSAPAATGEVTLEYHFWSRGPSTRVYNPYRHLLIPASFNVAVFDASKKHVGNIFSVANAGSQRNVGPGDWRALPEDCGVGMLMKWNGSRVYRPWIGDSIQLPPGEYQIQFVANSRFFLPPPQDKNGRFTADAALGWPHERVNADAMRSNRLTLEIN